MNYYTTVLKIALIFFVILFVYFCYYYPSYPTTFPPYKSTCPDYWKATKVYDNKVCIPNAKNLGSLDEPIKRNFDWKYYIEVNDLDISNDENTAWTHYLQVGRNDKLKVKFNGSFHIPGYVDDLDKEMTYVNFNDDKWDHSIRSRDCTYKAWANENNIEWEGVSNYNRCYL
jgi:hypothetical protein|tara:strand:+ start:4711 stop:5223 length:513 start_codon:yes stop_codon:yes gene_type:complete